MPRGLVLVFAVLLVALGVGSILAPAASAPAASQATPTSCPTTTAEKNKALVRRLFEEGWGQGNFAVVDEVVAEDLVAQIDPAGRDRLEPSIQELHTDFPDLRLTIEDMVAEEDRVASRLTYAGTQDDPLDSWSAPDTGRRAAREVWVFHRVACGRIAESRVLPDNLTLLRQLGIITDDELRTAGTPTVATPAP